jgi:rfaE bifunctional protein nucleotidyltransferase chain/domain
MNTRSKILLGDADLERLLAVHRSRSERVVLTNGTFDILHVGHVRALEDARSHGDCLIVGINTDASARRNKGPGRPVVPEAERAELVAALASVDAVLLFDEPTADLLIRKVSPDVYAKGRDYSEEALPETATAREVGARIAIVGDPKDHAASDLIARIRALPRGEGRG